MIINTLKRYLQLFYKHSTISFKTTLEYKFDRSLMAFAVFCREMINVAIMFLLLTRFVKIKGWGLDEIFFLYSFLFLSYTLFVFLFTGIRDFDTIIYSGEFDIFLIRPVGIMFQVIASRIDYVAILGHGAVGILLFLSTTGKIGITWNAANIAYYLSALLGGAVIQAAIFLFASTFTFWAVKTTNVRNLLFFNIRRFAGYPITFYPVIIQKLLIYIVPFAFVSYFPAQFFLRKPEIIQFWSGYLYLTPVIGVAVFFLVYLFWKVGLKYYSSTGNPMY